jgi:hypothetical protein
LTYRELVLAHASLVSCWEFTEASGPTAADSKGVSPGTYTGGITFREPGIPGGGNSIRLDGTSGWVQVVRNGTSLDVGDVFTFEVWAKQRTLLPSPQGLICRGQAAGYMRIQSSAGALQLDSTNVADIVASTTTPFAAIGVPWHHCVITKNGATVKQYVDGVDVTGTVTNSTCTSPVEDLAIGKQRAASAFAEGFIGWLAYPAVYNAAITFDEARLHWLAGSTIPDGDAHIPWTELGPGDFGADPFREPVIFIPTAGGTLTPIALGGSITPTGALTKQDNKALAGVVSPTGAIAKLASKPLSGAASPAGALAKQAQKALAGSISPVGTLALVRVVLKTFTGSISPTGNLTKLVLKPLGGNVAPAGALSKLVSKPLAGAVSPTGGLAKPVQKLLGGSISPTGALGLIKVTLRTFTGSISPTGTLGKQANKALAGSVSPIGTLKRQANKALTATVSPAGAIAKLVSKPLTGAISPAGALALTKVVIRSFTGSISPTGLLTRQPQKGLGGSITPAGALKRANSILRTGSITPVGSLGKLIGKKLAGAIAAVGSFVGQIVGATQPGTYVAFSVAHSSYAPDTVAVASFAPSTIEHSSYAPSSSAVAVYTLSHLLHSSFQS